MSPEGRIETYQGEKTRQRFARRPIEGSESQILMEPGSEVTMSRRVVRRAIAVARKMALSRLRMDSWTNRYRESGEELAGIGDTHENFRGIGNIGIRNEDATLIPTKTKIILDSQLLHDSLGNNFDKFFIEETQIVVNSSTGITADSLLRTLSRKLSRAGIRKKNQTPEIIRVNQVVKFKDKASDAFFKALEKGEIGLEEGAVTYDVELNYKLTPKKREKIPVEREDK